MNSHKKASKCLKVWRREGGGGSLTQLVVDAERICIIPVWLFFQCCTPTITFSLTRAGCCILIFTGFYIVTQVHFKCIHFSSERWHRFTRWYSSVNHDRSQNVTNCNSILCGAVNHDKSQNFTKCNSILCEADLQRFVLVNRKLPRGFVKPCCDMLVNRIFPLYLVK